MSFLKKYKSIILIVVIIGIGGSLYMIYFNNDKEISLISSSPSSVDSVIEKDLLALLNSIRLIKLDGSIFSDPAFNSLEDFSQVIDPEPIGRNNPFAPVY